MSRAPVAAGLGLGLCLTAGGFAATPLYVPGLALLVIAAVAVAWVSLAARSARLARSAPLPVVEEGVALPLTIQVRRSHWPLPGGELQPWPGGTPLAVPVRSQTAVTTTVRFPRRGRHRLGPATLSVSDPFGLWRRQVSSGADEILVLPRIEPVDWRDAGGDPSSLGRTARVTLSAEANEVDSLRPHRPETPASRIHWPALARTMTLMERHLVADADQRPVVVVDPRAPSSAEALDQAIRAAASLSVRLARDGGCALLLPGDRRPALLDPQLRAWPELHARLALLQPGAGGPPISGLARASAVLWVTAAPGAGVPLGRLPAAARYLVSPHRHAGLPVDFTVAGCSGQRLERAPARRRAA
jgi:uncharacterized protein (DUF58 family)